MGQPITWRSLQGPNPVDALNPLLASQQSFNNAFGTLERALQRSEGFEAKRFYEQREANKQAYLDALAGAKTPEQLAQLQASGKLDALKAALSPDGLAAVRGADEARATGLRQQLVADQQFGDNQALRAQREKEDFVAQLIAGGKHAEAAAFLDQNQLIGEARFHSALAGAKRTQVVQGREDTIFQNQVDKAKREAELAPLEKERLQAGINAANAQTNASIASVEAQKEARERAKKELEAATKAAQIEKERQFLKEEGNVYSDGVFNPSDTQDLQEMMLKNGIKDVDARNAIVARLSKLGGQRDLDYVNAENKLDKQKVHIPLSLVKQAILGASGGIFNRDSVWADSVEENLDAAMKQVAPMQLEDGRDYKQNKVVFDFKRYMQNRIQAAGSPGAVQIPRVRAAAPVQPRVGGNGGGSAARSTDWAAPYTRRRPGEF